MATLRVIYLTGEGRTYKRERERKRESDNASGGAGYRRTETGSEAEQDTGELKLDQKRLYTTTPADRIWRDRKREWREKRERGEKREEKKREREEKRERPYARTKRYDISKDSSELICTQRRSSAVVIGFAL